MTIYRFKGCSRCRGDLRYDEDMGEWVCVQGGHRFGPPVLETREADGAHHHTDSHKKRWTG